MAKWGEGDPRWIVEERADAANVNNWHWVEKNATPWSKERLPELFIGRTIEKGSIKVELTEFAKFEGEATANNRKAKLIFLYEWDMEIKFKANVAGSDIEYKGTLEIPNLSDENEASEIETSTKIDTRGPHEAELRQLLATDGLAFVRQQAGIYIRELKEQFSKGLILPTDAAKPQVITKGKTTSVVDKKSFQNEVISSASQKQSAPVSDGPVTTKKLEMTWTFKVSPERLYEILTQQDLMNAWSNSKAVSHVQENGEFSLLNGQISGFYTKLSPNKEILTKWRLKKYPENYYAEVKFTLRDQNDSTDLVIESIEADGHKTRFNTLLKWSYFVDR
ncbi:activator of hsp90 ATPase like protein 1-like protein domain-containing protein [Ditylenchus destructor]|uniref:Activator of hsp90 ATPase like protein 1-like protein domain-containing protein n=1 Tax=Ditylenchus destructor TaxID=166010 RepID=A0AAD4R3P4_9BILA|nr:activator of hsp90 ATPase like protein 1-like protein domain-containing protein [Ditylenchus destructor]